MNIIIDIPDDVPIALKQKVERVHLDVKNGSDRLPKVVQSQVELFGITLFEQSVIQLTIKVSKEVATHTGTTKKFTSHTSLVKDDKANDVQLIMRYVFVRTQSICREFNNQK